MKEILDFGNIHFDKMKLKTKRWIYFKMPFIGVRILNPTYTLKYQLPFNDFVKHNNVDNNYQYFSIVQNPLRRVVRHYMAISEIIVPPISEHVVPVVSEVIVPF